MPAVEYSLAIVSIVQNNARTNKNENMMQPTNSHFPTLKGMKKQPSWSWHLAKISFDQPDVVNIVMAEKISET